jgi:hypothetical protein
MKTLKDYLPKDYTHITDYEIQDDGTIFVKFSIFYKEQLVFQYDGYVEDIEEFITDCIDACKEYERDRKIDKILEK